jgi:hypothetical protein
MRQRDVVVGQGQQIVEEDAVMAGPGKMLGEQRRLVNLDEAPEPSEVRAVEPRGPADGEATPWIDSG